MANNYQPFKNSELAFAFDDLYHTLNVTRAAVSTLDQNETASIHAQLSNAISTIDTLYDRAQSLAEKEERQTSIAAHRKNAEKKIRRYQLSILQRSIAPTLAMLSIAVLALVAVGGLL